MFEVPVSFFKININNQFQSVVKSLADKNWPIATCPICLTRILLFQKLIHFELIYHSYNSILSTEKSALIHPSAEQTSSNMFLWRMHYKLLLLECHVVVGTTIYVALIYFAKTKK